MSEQQNPEGKVEVPKTFRSGPSDPIAFSDGVGTFAEVAIAAPLADVWPLVTDINLPSKFSAEFQSAEWKGDGPAMDEVFVGTNENTYLGQWDIECIVDRFEPDSEFGWATVDKSNPGARWWFTMTEADGGTHLRYDVTLGPGGSGLTMALESMPDKEPRILSGRLRELHTGMRATVEGIRDIAEGKSQD